MTDGEKLAALEEAMGLIQRIADHSSPVLGGLLHRGVMPTLARIRNHLAHVCGFCDKEKEHAT